MDFKQMILVDTFFNKTLNGWGNPSSKLVFEFNESIYTGEFFERSENGQPITYKYHSDFGFFENKLMLTTNSAQCLRDALLEHVFGKDNNPSQQVWVQYTKEMKHIVLKDVIEVVSNLDIDEYFSDEIDIPEILINLENLETGMKWDYYNATDKVFKPVAFTDLFKEEENN